MVSTWSVRNHKVGICRIVQLSRSGFEIPSGENRSFYEGNTGSRSITEVKLHQASIVLR